MNTKLQVLVIDDDAVVGRSFDRVLSDKGYEVSTALSGEEALETMENTEFRCRFHRYQNAWYGWSGSHRTYQGQMPVDSCGCDHRLWHRGQ